jgi:hypothetical protein
VARKTHAKAVTRSRRVPPAKVPLPVRLTKAQAEELDRRAEDTEDGRTEGVPLDTVLDQDVLRPR